MTKVKICGLRRKEDIDMVNLLRPDYIGFVFAPSRRQISLAQANDLKRRLHTGIQAVGVFVDAPLQELLTVSRSGSIDVIQLHGHETEADILALKEQCSLPVIKAVRVQSAAQIQQYSAFPCDYLLLDTFTPGQMGGSGTTFDWSMIPAISKPYFLAGGLSPENVGDIFPRLSPYAIDVSSGVETNGVKDYNKLKKFMDKVKEGDSYEQR